MDYTMLHSKRCSGHLSVDVSDMFCIRSPSLAFSPAGLTIGVLEITGKNFKMEQVKFICSRCEQQLSIEEVVEKSICQCVLCKEIKPAAEMFSANETMLVCENCVNIITGKSKEEASPQLQKVIQYIFMPTRKSAERTFTRIVDILKKPVKF